MPQPLARSRDRDAEVREPAADEAQHLVAAVLGRDAEPAALDLGEQPVAVTREPEEPVALGDALRRPAVLGAEPVHELGGREERLAARAIQPLVVAFVEIARGGAGAPQPLDAGGMAPVDARPDEVVVRERQHVAERREALRLFPNEHLDRKTCRLGRHDVLQRIVVRAAQEANVLAAQAAMPREDVRLHELEGEPEMRVAVDVRDRGRDVETSLAHRYLLPGPAGPSNRRVATPSVGPTSTTRTRARRKALSAGPSSERTQRAKSSPHDSPRTRGGRGRDESRPYFAIAGTTRPDSSSCAFQSVNTDSISEMSAPRSASRIG